MNKYLILRLIDYYLRKFIFPIIILFLLNQNLFPQLKKEYSVQKNYDFEYSNLPLFFINTNGQEIVDEYRIDADMGVIYNDSGKVNYLADSLNNYNGKITIELRGSSSIAYPKKQFRIETVDSTGENLNVKLCGLPKENDWILNGPYNDKTLLRNAISYGLSNKIGRYASRVIFVELFLNNEYQGVYLLLETVKRDKHRVNIAENLNDISGGYIVKIDKMDGENYDMWYSNYGTPYQYHYPKANEITANQKSYIQNYFNDFEELMFTHPENYKNFIDDGSFVDHLILGEFTKNVDAFRLSSYLYKDRDSINGKLFAGPIWDYNLTFGDAWNEEDMFRADGWQVNYTIDHPYDGFRVPFWWNKLFENQEFKEKFTRRWYSLRENVLSYDSLFSTIDSLVDYTAEARVRNFNKWTGIINPNNYYDEILTLKGWIIRRINWIEENLPNITSTNEENPTVISEFNLYQNYPNPFNPTTTIEYSIPSNVKSETSKAKLIAQVSVQLNIYDALGNVVKTLVKKNQRPGNYKINFDATDLSSGVYFYQLKTDHFIQSKKMLLLK